MHTTPILNIQPVLRMTDMEYYAGSMSVTDIGEIPIHVITQRCFHHDQRLSLEKSWRKCTSCNRMNSTDQVLKCKQKQQSPNTRQYDQRFVL